MRVPSFIQLVSFGFTASGPGRCKINNGGCWHEARNGHAFSACSVSYQVSWHSTNWIL